VNSGEFNFNDEQFVDKKSKKKRWLLLLLLSIFLFVSIGVTYTVIVSRDNNPEEIPGGTIVTPGSSDASLRTLVVEGHDFTLEFDPDTLAYYLEVDCEVETITIGAEATQPGVNVTGSGVRNLEEGANTFVIIVPAEDGVTIREYVIVVYRKSCEIETPPTSPTCNNDTTLRNLGVSGQSRPLTPAFNRNVRFYSLTVDADLTHLTITATANTPSTSTVTGTGRVNLNPGWNTFVVTVRSECGTIGRYTITIYRERRPDEPPITPNLSIIYEGGPEFIADNLTPGSNVGPKTFRVINAGDCVLYNVLWTQVVNEFERQEDLVMTIYRNGTRVRDLQAPAMNTHMFQDVRLNRGEIHEYEIFFEYKSAGVNQDVDQGKAFSTVINVDENAKRCP